MTLPLARADGGGGQTTRASILATMARHREWPILVVSVLAGCFFAVTAPNFTTWTSLGTLATYVAPTAIIAVGMTLLMIAGEIDIAVGKVFAFAPIVVVICTDAGLPLAIAVGIGLLASGLIGAISGILTVLTGLSSFIVTLAMYFLVNGLNLIVTDGIPSMTPGQGTYRLLFGGGRFSEIVWAVGLAMVLQFVLTKTRFGMHTIAVGANPTGAREVGIGVKAVKIRAFALASMAAGLAGILEAVRVTSTEPIAGGSSTTFYAIAAVVMGGTVLTGGAGTVAGSFFGALFLGVVRDGFTLAGVSAYSFDLIVGAAILVALGVNAVVLRMGTRWTR